VYMCLSLSLDQGVRKSFPLSLNQIIPNQILKKKQMEKVLV
jgi:hypothetical protein